MIRIAINPDLNLVIVIIGACQLYEEETNELIKPFIEKGLIYLVEPAHSNIQKLYEKFGKNQNIIIIKAAISSRDGKGFLHLSRGILSHTLKEPRENKKEQYIGEEKVSLYTWKTLVENFEIKIVDVCQIDAEGSEEDILESMTNCKILPRVLLLSHYHDKHFKNLKSKKELEEKMKELGYSIVSEGDNELRGEMKE